MPPPKFRMEWVASSVIQKVQQASANGIDETMAACVMTAKPLTPVVTGTLQGSIRFNPASLKGRDVVGEWGSFDVNYAMKIELRRFMLRRAADQHYPGLAKRIKQHFGAL